MAQRRSLPCGALYGALAAIYLRIADQLATERDLEPAIAHRAGDATGGGDEQPVAHDEIAFEPTGDLRLVDLGIALEQARLGDLHQIAAGDRGLDTAFHH